MEITYFKLEASHNWWLKTGIIKNAFSEDKAIQLNQLNNIIKTKQKLSSKIKKIKINPNAPPTGSIILDKLKEQRHTRIHMPVW